MGQLDFLDDSEQTILQLMQKPPEPEITYSNSGLQTFRWQENIPKLPDDFDISIWNKNPYESKHGFTIPELHTLTVQHLPDLTQWQLAKTLQRLEQRSLVVLRPSDPMTADWRKLRWYLSIDTELNNEPLEPEPAQ